MCAASIMRPLARCHSGIAPGGRGPQCPRQGRKESNWWTTLYLNGIATPFGDGPTVPITLLLPALDMVAPLTTAKPVPLSCRCIARHPDAAGGALEFTPMPLLAMVVLDALMKPPPESAGPSRWRS